jgi:hypothetical protein
MPIVALDHTGVAVPELRGDHEQRHAPLDTAGMFSSNSTGRPGSVGGARRLSRNRARDVLAGRSELELVDDVRRRRGHQPHRIALVRRAHCSVEVEGSRRFPGSDLDFEANLHDLCGRHTKISGW